MAKCYQAKTDLEYFIKQIKKFSKYEWKLEFYGSTVSGLMSPNSSDIDMTLIIAQKDKNEVAHVFHLEVLEAIKSILPSQRYTQCITLKMKRLYALRITDDFLDIKIDMCINNVLGIVNSQMIRTYCLMDRRFHEMCLIMKMVHDEMKPYGRQIQKKLTNFSLNLMILVFL